MQQIRQNIARSQVGRFLKSAGETEEEAEFGTSYREQVRLRLHSLCDDADSSRAAWLFANFIIACIFVSVVGFCVETVPELEFAYAEYWFNLEVFMVGVFTVEYLARLWSTPKTWWAFLTDTFNVIDVLSILPFYIYLLLSAVSPVDLFMLRIFRLFRLVQMLKMARYSKMLSLIVRALQETRDIIVLLLFAFLIVAVLFATLLFMAERGEWDAVQGCYVRTSRPDLGCSPFDSVPATMYWAVTTLTGVGYGDHYPVTPWGKAIASAAMIVGILALALPVVLIGVQMSNTMVFLRSEMDSRAHQKVESEELFRAVMEFDAVCLRMAMLGEECQKLALGSAAHKIKREKGDYEDDHADDIIALVKPTEIICQKMLNRWLDLKRYVNAVDINEHANQTHNA